MDQILQIFPGTAKLDDLDALLSYNRGTDNAAVSAVCNDLIIDSNRPITAAEFYDLVTDQKVWLPYADMVRATGSNGMCAGNNFAETVVQGICEILEREALKQIFSEKIVPPAIPDHVLRQCSSYEFIQQLRAKGITVTVRDCSLDKGYPVLGALLVDKNTGKYRFALGAHPCIDYALERTFGELCLSFENIEKVLDAGEEIDLSSDPFAPAARKGDRNFWKTVNYFNHLIRGRGNLPRSFFTDEATYRFKDRRKFSNSTSYQEDLTILNEILAKNGHNILIRDVSFLNFPAFYVYITGLSPVEYNLPWNCACQIERMINFCRNRRSATDLSKVVRNLNSASHSEAADLLDWISLYVESSPYYYLGDAYEWLTALFHLPVVDGRKPVKEYLLAMLLFKLKDYANASTEIRQLLMRYKFLPKNQFDLKNKTFLSAFKDSLYLAHEGYTSGKIQHTLEPYYDQQTIEQIIAGIDRKVEIFDTNEIVELIDFDVGDSTRQLVERIKQIIEIDRTIP